MLEVKELTLEVQGRVVLKDISIKVEKGETLALLGPNGSGKTSLLMAIMGFSDYKVTKGTIVFKDKVINDMPIDERAKFGIGVMFQRPPTIRGIRVGGMINIIKTHKIELQKEAEQLHLSNFMNRDLNLGFSGGEIKRTELLQLLATKPELTLFDEPESGVDLENIALVGNSMNKILNSRQDNAGIIITHTGHIFEYVKPLKGCIIAGGKLHCTGSPQKILKTIKKHGYEWCASCQGEKMKKH